MGRNSDGKKSKRLADRINYKVVNESVSNLPKLSFDRFSSNLHCFEQCSHKRKIWNALRANERAKRVLLHVLRCEPPPEFWALWFKTIMAIGKVRGHLRCPQRFLKLLRPALSRLREIEIRTIPLLGLWRLDLPS